MGISGLTAFVEGRGATRNIDLMAQGRAIAREREKLASDPENASVLPSNEIVVDGNGLLRRLYSPHIDWCRGGQFERLKDEVKSFVEKFSRAGWQLTVIFDGQVEAEKRKVWISRRIAESRRAEKIMEHIAAQEPLSPEKQELPPRKLWFMPISTTRMIPNAFKDAGCKVLFSLSEADREVAFYAVNNNAWAVLADDSDYLAFDLPRVLSVKNLKGLRTTVIERSAKLAIFPNLDPAYWPLLATLAGNDYGARFMSLGSFVLDVDTPPETEKDEDDYFAKAASFIVEKIQSQGIKHNDTNAIAAAILTHAKSVPSPFRRPSASSFENRLKRSLGQYSFHDIRNTVDTHLVPPALRSPKLWEKIIAMHVNGEMDYECLSILAKRVVNFGVVVEKNGGEFPGTWDVAKEVFRTAYGVLLGDTAMAEEKKKGSGPSGVKPVPLTSTSGSQAQSTSPKPPATALSSSTSAPPPPPPAFVDPAVLLAVPAGKPVSYQPVQLPGSPSLWPSPNSPASLGSGSSPALPPEPEFDLDADDGIDEQGFSQSVSMLTGLVGDDLDLGTLKLDDEFPADDEPLEEAEIEEADDDLEKEARELLVQQGGLEEDDDDLSTVAEMESTEGTATVVEWVMSAGVPFGEPTRTEPVFEMGGQKVPSFSEMLAASTADRLKAFYLCSKAPAGFSLSPGTPMVLHAVCLALRHLILHPGLSGKLDPLDIQALLAQAVSLSLRSPNYRGRPASSATAFEVPLSTKATQLGNIFLRTMLAFSFINDACCRPLGDDVARSWKYYDGIQWQRRRLSGEQGAERGVQPADCMLDRPVEASIFRGCWRSLVQGTPWEVLARGQPSRGRGRAGMVAFSSGRPGRGGFAERGRRNEFAGPTSMAPPVAIYGRRETPPSLNDRRPPPATSSGRTASPSVQQQQLPSGLIVQKTIVTAAGANGNGNGDAAAKDRSAKPSNTPTSRPQGKPSRAPPQPRQDPQPDVLNKLQNTLESVKATLEKQKAEQGTTTAPPARRGRGGTSSTRGEPKTRGQPRAPRESANPTNTNGTSPENGQRRTEQQPITPGGICPFYARGSCKDGVDCPMQHVAGVQKPVRRQAV